MTVSGKRMRSFFARKTSPNFGTSPRVRPSGTGLDSRRKRCCKKSAILRNH